MTSTSSGLTMLTTGVSQYIHPDYLQPLNATLDAKNSPLALLAQTCSAIGKDTSPTKPIIPPLEKKEGDNIKIEKSDSESNKRPRSHGMKDSDRDSKSASSFRTSFPPKEIPPLVPISGPVSTDKPLSLSIEPKSTSPSGPVGASIPSSLPPASSMPPASRPLSAHSQPRSTSRSSSGKGEGPIDLHQHHSSYSRSRESPASSSSSSHHHREATPPHSKPSRSSPSMSSAYSSPSSLPSSSSSLSTSTSTTSSSTVKPSPTHPSLLSGLHNPAHLAGYPNPLALMGHGLDPSSPSYHSALAAAAAAHSSLSSYSAAAAAAQSSALKAAAAAGAGAPSAISPFVTYARIRTPSGATTLVPICRDPYCSTCQLTLQNQHLAATCQTPGCAQCIHEKSLTSLSTLGFSGSPSAAASSMLLPPISGSSSLTSSMSALSSLHSLYPHSALAAAHQQSLQAAQTPQVCNWYSGGEYCGKRFSTSEELLQHLRTHTSSMDASALAASSLAASYASSLGLPSALAGYPHLGAPGGLNPASLSPNSLRRQYPTSLSPVSSLLSASRYHPYKSPLSAAPGVGTPPSAVPPQNLPPVGPYYSPYTLYGQRIGAAVVP